jgi:N-methylhydantoinase B
LIDAITLELLGFRLAETVATMEHLLFHSGYSTVLRESYDGSAGLCDLNGRAIIGSGFPIHIMPYYYSVQGVLARHPLETMEAGDSFAINDPYVGGSFHTPDVAIVTPIFVGSHPVAYAVSIAHKPDIGGMVPGSASGQSRELYHEGLLLPGVRYWSSRGVEADIDGIIRQNSRQPTLTSGDMRAQVGCTLKGAEMVRAIADEYGTEALSEASERLQQSSEMRLRKGIAEWDDGTAEGEVFLDNDGVDTGPPVRLHTRVTKVGDEITFDFSGTADQIRGPLNIPHQAAETAALIALVGFVDPSIALNGGCQRPVSFVNPAGKLTNPLRPAPVSTYFRIMSMLYSAALVALAEFDTSKAVGSAGFGFGSGTVGYRRGRSGRATVQYELLMPSLGGSSSGDGAFVVQPMSHITPNTPIEVLETEYPVVIERFEPIADSAGPGRNRGGAGYRKRYRYLDDVHLSLRRNQFNFEGPGVLGGHPPGRRTVLVNPGTPTELIVEDMRALELVAGDVVEFQIAGGAGYGDPHERETDRVLEDVLDGFVSVEGANRDYGVAVDSTGLSVDLELTREFRGRVAQHR